MDFDKIKSDPSRAIDLITKLETTLTKLVDGESITLGHAADKIKIAELEAQVAELKTIIGSTAKGHDALCTCACCVEVDRVYNEAKPKGDQPSDKSDIPWRYRSQGKGR